MLNIALPKASLFLAMMDHALIPFAHKYRKSTHVQTTYLIYVKLGNAQKEKSFAL